MSVNSFGGLEAALRYEFKRASTLRASAEADRRQGARRLDDLELDALAGVCRWLFNCAPRPHFVVDGCLNVLFLNTAAERLLADATTITMSAGRLIFEGKESEAELGRVFAKKVDRASFTIRVGSAAETVTVSRIPGHQTAQNPLLVTITCGTKHSSALLQTAFDLTRAESEIALAMFRGSALTSIAHERRASINTVKTQVRYIFRKLSVNSQAGVIRRVAEILQEPSVRA